MWFFAHLRLACHKMLRALGMCPGVFGEKLTGRHGARTPGLSQQQNRANPTSGLSHFCRLRRSGSVRTATSPVKTRLAATVAEKAAANS